MRASLRRCADHRADRAWRAPLASGSPRRPPGADPRAEWSCFLPHRSRDALPPLPVGAHVRHGVPDRGGAPRPRPAGPRRPSHAAGASPPPPPAHPAHPRVHGWRRAPSRRRVRTGAIPQLAGRSRRTSHSRWSRQRPSGANVISRMPSSSARMPLSGSVARTFQCATPTSAFTRGRRGRTPRRPASHASEPPCPRLER